MYYERLIRAHVAAAALFGSDPACDRCLSSCQLGPLDSTHVYLCSVNSSTHAPAASLRTVVSSEHCVHAANVRRADSRGSLEWTPAATRVFVFMSIHSEVLLPFPQLNPLEQRRALALRSLDLCVRPLLCQLLSAPLEEATCSVHADGRRRALRPIEPRGVVVQPVM